MSIIASVSKFDSDEFEAPEFKRLSAQEAQALRKLRPPLSPWQVLGLQAIAGLLVTLVVWGLTGRSAAAWSAAYGAVAVIIPALLFARGLMSQFSSINAATAAFGFFVWEAVKIAVSIGLLAVAARWVPELDWLSLLAGLVVTLKVYWVALLIHPKAKT